MAGALPLALGAAGIGANQYQGMKAREEGQRLLSGGNAAAGALLRGAQLSPQMNTPLKVTRSEVMPPMLNAGDASFSYSGGQPQAPKSLMDPQTRLGLETQVMGGPLQMYAAQQAQQAKANELYTLNPGDVRMQGNKTVASAPFAPKDPEVFKFTNMQRPGTNDVKTARTQAEMDDLIGKGYAQAGNTVPGAPAPKDPEKPDYSRVDYWRGQIKPELQAANEAMLSYNKLNNSINEGGAGLSTAIQLLQKMIDEKGVVRGEDVTMYQQAQPVLDALKQELQTSSDGKLTAESKVKLSTLAKSLAKTRTDAFQSNYRAMIPNIRSEKVNPSQVVPDEVLSGFAFKDAAPANTLSQLPQDAVQAQDAKGVYYTSPSMPNKKIRPQ
jgi:hypothetical protein